MKYIFSICVVVCISTLSLQADALSAMRQKIAQQDERIDGLTTIIEGLSASLYALQTKNKQVDASPNNDVLLKKLAKMIDEINANYVTKEELDVALGHKTTAKAPVLNQVKSQVKNNSLEEKTNATLYSEAVRHFVKQRYDEAKKRFTITDVHAYKPAASNYYLGEIAYYTKQYEDAVFILKRVLDCMIKPLIWTHCFYTLLSL